MERMRVATISAPVLGTVRALTLSEPITKPDLRRPEMHGTAFAIAEDLFLTAGHVVEGIEELGHGCLGFTNGAGALIAAPIEATHQLGHGVDVGVIRARVPPEAPPMRVHHWKRDADMGAHVAAFGFPHGYDADAEAVVMRMFGGWVVSRGGFSDIPSGKKGIPRVELSFPCPKGISGAPLMTRHGLSRVLGVVVGNSAVSYVMGSTEEDEGAEKVEIRDTVFLGQAHLLAAFEAHPVGLVDGTFRDLLHVH